MFHAVSVHRMDFSFELPVFTGCAREANFRKASLLKTSFLYNLLLADNFSQALL